jgi:hypothetical protein
MQDAKPESNLWVGIDVAKRHFDVALLPGGHTCRLTYDDGLAANQSFGAQSFNLTLSGSRLSRNTVNAPGADLLMPKPNYVPN